MTALQPKTMVTVGITNVDVLKALILHRAGRIHVGQGVARREAGGGRREAVEYATLTPEHED